MFKYFALFLSISIMSSEAASHWVQSQQERKSFLEMSNNQSAQLSISLLAEELQSLLESLRNPFGKLIKKPDFSKSITKETLSKVKAKLAPFFIESLSLKAQNKSCDIKNLKLREKLSHHGDLFFRISIKFKCQKSAEKFIFSSELFEKFAVDQFKQLTLKRLQHPPVVVLINNGPIAFTTSSPVL